MKKKLLLVVIALLSVNFICQAQQLTVAVSRFEARNGQTKDDAEGITELFIAELVANGNVRVVDRNSFDKIMAEMQFQDTDWADRNKVAQLGKAMNANSIIRGKLMSLSDHTVISASILDINTAQILSSSTVQMANLEDVFTEIKGLVKTMANNLPRSSQPVSTQILTMAVSPFDIRGGLSADELEVVMELFIAQFVTGGAKVVDRNSFDKIIAEMKFQDSDWADSNKVAQLGRALNANSIIRGTVTSLAGQISVTSTILDINTAQILSSATMRVQNKNQIFTNVPGFAFELKMNLPINLGGIGGAPKIGGKGQGGIVFYDKGIYSDGWRFLEAAPDNTEFNRVEWGAYEKDIVTSTLVGSGKRNTELIVAMLRQLRETGRAAQLCASLNFNGFADWFLPSRDELDLIYKNLKQKGLGGFSNTSYWSSSQGNIPQNADPLAPVDNMLAWAHYFGDGTQRINIKKNGSNSVRAIRQF